MCRWFYCHQLKGWTTNTVAQSTIIAQNSFDSSENMLVVHVHGPPSKMNILTGLYGMFTYQRTACEGSVLLTLLNWRLIVHMFRVNPSVLLFLYCNTNTLNFSSLSLFPFLFSSYGAFIMLLSYTTLCSGLHFSPSILFLPCFAAPSAWAWWLENFKRAGESGAHLISDLSSSVLFEKTQMRRSQKPKPGLFDSVFCFS